MLITRYNWLFFLFITGVVLASSVALSEPVKCSQCTREDPCVTMFEFKNLRFTHDVYCENKDGKAVWDSDDEEKFDMFYFEVPDKKNSMNEVDI